MALQSLNDAVRRLFDSLGLPVVQAPGEAEATCAALQRAGLVHACATTDSDAFAFGATRIFKALHLVVSSPTTTLSQCQLQILLNTLPNGMDSVLHDQDERGSSKTIHFTTPGILQYANSITCSICKLLARALCYFAADLNFKIQSRLTLSIQQAIARLCQSGCKFPWSIQYEMSFLTQVGSPKLNEMKYCDVRSFCKWLDITNGGSQAFIVLSLMVGGDYSDGVDRIGPTSALQFIKFLLKDEQDDFNLMELLHASLMPSSGQNLKALPTQCSGRADSYGHQNQYHLSFMSTCMRSAVKSKY